MHEIANKIFTFKLKKKKFHVKLIRNAKREENDPDDGERSKIPRYCKFFYISTSESVQCSFD